MSSCVIRSRPAHPNNTDSNKFSHTQRAEIINEFNVGIFFKTDTHVADGDINSGTEDGATYTMYIAEEKLQECSRITLKIEQQEVPAILDTGRELTLMNENLYNKIQQTGSKYRELPAQHLTLVSAFNDKRRSVRKQTMLPVKLANFTFITCFSCSFDYAY